MFHGEKKNSFLIHSLCLWNAEKDDNLLISIFLHIKIWMNHKFSLRAGIALAYDILRVFPTIKFIHDIFKYHITYNVGFLNHTIVISNNQFVGVKTTCNLTAISCVLSFWNDINI